MNYVRTVLSVRRRGCQWRGFVCLLFLVFANSGCRGLFSVARVAIRMANPKPVAPDQVVFRSAAIEPTAIAGTAWLDICVPAGIRSVAAFQGTTKIEDGRSSRRHIPTGLGADADINWLCRLQPVRDGELTVIVSDPTPWPPDCSGYGVGFPTVASPY